MKGPDATAEILAWLQLLKTRPGLIVPTSQPTYEQITYYISGYLDGIGRAVGRRLQSNFHNWTTQQRRIAVPCSWARYLQLTHEELSESQFMELFLEDVATYFTQNPDWQEKDIPLRLWFDEDE